MEAGVGVNSPEFLQKKIERLKTALDEANMLMDRHVTERDEARAELAAIKRENDELKRQVAAGGGAAAAAEPAAPAVDPAIEKELRDRIAQLESERESLQSGAPEAEQELRTRIQSLESQLATTKGDLDASRRETDN